LIGRYGGINVIHFINKKFEILSEEEEEIDIQAIKGFKDGIISISSDDSEKESEFREYIVENRHKIEEVIKALKQLDKKIK
jgi:hypothetical protein